MALNGQYVTVDSIIERVKRDTGFTIEIDKWDCVEWLFDLIDFVGAPTAFVEKTTDGNEDLDHSNPIEIVNYRGKLPIDFHTCIACRTYPQGYAMTSSSDLFHVSSFNLSTASYAPSTDYDLPTQVETQNTHTTYSYRLNNDYIFTDFEEGYVELSYLAFPADKDGYPLIPDNTRYIHAAVAHISERVGFKLWMQNKLADAKYAKLEQERMWYIGSAGNAARTLNADQREAFKNQVLRMIPVSNSHSQHNKYLSSPQYLRNFKTR